MIELVHSYDPVLFVTSVVIAAFGGYVALRLIGRVRAIESSTRRAVWWLAAASAAMGVGIWSMHFTGMLALRLPVPVGYETGLTLLSAIIAVGVSLLALWVVQREQVPTLHLLGAAVLMGSAISGMHYTGMAAMRLPGEMSYRPGLVVASIAVAITASGVALWLFLQYRDRTGLSGFQWDKVVVGIVLGLAVSGMHYTAMAAARYRNLRPDAALPGAEGLLTDELAVWVTVGSLVLLGLGLLVVLLDQLYLNYSAEIRESRRRYETLLSEISDVVSVLGEDGTVRYHSPSVERLFGHEPEERVGQSAFANVHPDDIEDVREAFARSVTDGEEVTLQYRLRHAAGSWRRVESTSVVPEDESLGAMVVVTRDVTDRTEAQQKYRTIFDMTPTPVGLSTLEDGQLVDVNPTFEELLGYSRDELIGSTSEELGLWALPDQREQVTERLRETGSVHNLEVAFRDAEGEVLDTLFSGSVLELGERPHFLGIIQDITERKQFEEKLEHQALHDQLTGLPNRTLLEDRLEHALKRAEREKTPISVLFLDLDRFKAVNDSHGHSVGDQLLCLLSDRLRATLRAEDTLARIGGDEFVVLLEDSGEERARRTAERLRSALVRPYKLDGTGVSVGVSIGLVVNEPADRPGFARGEDLLKAADAAMYQVKKQSERSVHVYSPEDQTPGQRLRREERLRAAIEDEELVVYYQPILELAEGRVAGAEALVRWAHPEQGLIPPNDFVPLAEETGLIRALDDWVLEESIRQAKEWDENPEFSLPPDFRVAVNVAPHRYEEEDLAESLLSELRRVGLDPEALQLEITERVALQETAPFHELRENGVHLAIDDFGTGYSSLMYPRNLEADALKVDRFFVHELEEEERTSIIVRSLLSIGAQLGLDVIAEGVETEEQRDHLLDLGCRLAQGYLFAHPMPAADFFEELLRSEAAWTPA